MPSTCGCRAIRRACARSAGPWAASGSPPRAPSSSCSGRSPARTARWASSRRWSAAFAVRATAVACHPKQEVVAVGYADGTVLLVRIEDGAEVLGKKPGEGAGQRARLGCCRYAARLRHRSRRSGRDRSRLTVIQKRPRHRTAKIDSDVTAVACGRPLRSSSEFDGIQRTSTLLNCQGSLRSISSGNSPGRPTSGVQSV